MWKKIFFTAICLLFLLVKPAIAQSARYAIAAPSFTEIHIALGTAQNELKFVPNQLKFEKGKSYKLILDNPSNVKHYFTSKDFADAIWTAKVNAGNVEIKGAIHELELKPKAHAEWVFVPIKPGKYYLHCTIAGHTEAGMIGDIIIE